MLPTGDAGVSRDVSILADTGNHSSRDRGLSVNVRGVEGLLRAQVQLETRQGRRPVVGANVPP